jgi:hypothetical protein
MTNVHLEIYAKGIKTSVMVNDVCFVRWPCAHHSPALMQQANAKHSLCAWGALARYFFSGSSFSVDVLFKS